MLHIYLLPNLLQSYYHILCNSMGHCTLDKNLYCNVSTSNQNQNRTLDYIDIHPHQNVNFKDIYISQNISHLF